MAMALIEGPKSFYALRFLLGVAEAGFFPGVLYLITQWYPVRHRGKIMGMFVLSQADCDDGCRSIGGSITRHGWCCKYARLAVVIYCSRFCLQLSLPYRHIYTYQMILIKLIG